MTKETVFFTLQVSYNPSEDDNSRKYERINANSENDLLVSYYRMKKLYSEFGCCKFNIESYQKITALDLKWPDIIESDMEPE